MYADNIGHSFLSKIEVIPRTNVEIISFLQGKLRILPEMVNQTLINGHARLIADGNVDYFIPIKVDVQRQQIGKDIIKGFTYLDKARFNEKILQGTTSFGKNDLKEDLFTGNIRYIANSINDIEGSLTYEREKVITDIAGATSIEAEDYHRNLFRGTAVLNKSKAYWTLLECNDAKIETDNYAEDILEGSIDYQENERVLDIYGNAKLEKSGNIQENIIFGTTKTEVEQEEIDLLTGNLTIYSQYSAAEFPCRIKIDKKKFIHSLFCKLTVPPNRKYDIPCKIQVEGMNKSENIILDGTVSLLDRDSYSNDILSDNHVIYLPGATVDIDCSATVNAVHTRKEALYCKINVVDTTDFDIPCKLEVEPPADYWFYQEILYSKLIVGSKYEYNLDSKVEVEPNDSGDINSYEYRNYGPRPQSRIVIVVSPTWTYEPFVFKSSLVTFLDRYYGKADFSIVFGGSARADFDIMNLAANYKIRRERLLRVPILVDFKNPIVTKNSVDHFIYHMFNFKEGEPKIISRVFLFMNQPSWYYNDPISKIAEVCIKNQISCVAINGGGEYQELTKIDRARDEMYNNIEYDRQQRMHPNYGFINVQYKEDPNKITY